MGATSNTGSSAPSPSSARYASCHIRGVRSKPRHTVRPSGKPTLAGHGWYRPDYGYALGDVSDEDWDAGSGPGVRPVLGLGPGLGVGPRLGVGVALGVGPKLGTGPGVSGVPCAKTTPELTHSKAATENTARIEERMAFSRNRRHSCISFQHQNDCFASTGMDFLKGFNNRYSNSERTAVDCHAPHLC